MTTLTHPRAALDDHGAYSHPAPVELLVGIALVGYFIKHQTGDDLCNWATAATYRTDCFELRGDNDDNDTLPNFSFGDNTGFDVAWYKECGRATTVSRLLTDDEIVTAIGTCLQSLSVELPDTVEDLYLYGHRPDRSVVQRLLAAAT